jgi:glycosyltransferase involved in cell wall biosynthesis
MGAWVRATCRTWPPVVEAAVTKSALVRLNELVSESWPEVVVAEENMAGAFLRFLPPRLPKVWVKHSIYAVDAEQYRTRSNSSRIRPWYVERLVRRYEAETLRLADIVVVMAQEDADELTRRYGPQRVEVVGCGANTALLPWRPDPGTHVAAFVASFGWQANADAAEWLVREIWPLVVRKVPDAHLRLIGNGLDSVLASEARSQGIEVAGYVDDLVRALRDVAVGLVPIKLGTGVRVKFLENLSLGIPTVTTRLGSRGTGVADGIHCLHAETPAQFAAAVASVLLNPSLRHSLSDSARELRSWLSWDARAQEMEDVLLRLKFGAHIAGGDTGKHELSARSTGLVP